MKTVIKLEEFGFLILSFLLFLQSQLNWWWFLILLLTPDISMLGYLFGPKTGAIIYNLFHHRGLAIAWIASGYYWNMDILYISGVIMLGHASLDRIFGYGLKHDKGFKFTHLGEIGN